MAPSCAAACRATCTGLGGHGAASQLAEDVLRAFGRGDGAGRADGPPMTTASSGTPAGKVCTKPPAAVGDAAMAAVGYVLAVGDDPEPAERGTMAAATAAASWSPPPAELCGVMAMLRIGLRASGEPPESSLLALPGVSGACAPGHAAGEGTADQNST